jgi:hypothetical protein
MFKAARSGSPLLALPVLALAAAAVPACGQQANLDEAAAGEATDSTEVTQSESALIAAGVDDDATSMTAADIAAAAAAHAAARFQPAGCATVTVTGTTVTTTLAGCTGRFGLLHVTGTVTSVFTDASDGVDVTTTAQGLAVNRAVLNVNATAVITQQGSVRTLTVNTDGSGTGPRGNAFTRQGTYTVVRDLATSCISLSGQWQVNVAGLTRTTSVTGFQDCDGMCPAAGGEVMYTGFRGRTVTLTFDGTANADWSSSTGKSGTIDLACGG